MRYPIQEAVSVALHTLDEFPRDLTVILFEGHIKYDEYAKAEDVAHSDLVAGKLDSQLLDPIFQQIGIKLQQGGAYFVQQGQKAQDY